MTNTLSYFFGENYTEQDAIKELAAIRKELAAVEKLQAEYPNPSVHLRNDARKAGLERYIQFVGHAGDYMVHGFDDAKIAKERATLDKTPAQMVAEMVARNEKSERW